MNKEQAKDQLLQLYENQIQDLTVMSKIELGDDVIKEIHRLKMIINSQDMPPEYDKINQENFWDLVDNKSNIICVEQPCFEYLIENPYQVRYEPEVKGEWVVDEKNPKWRAIIVQTYTYGVPVPNKNQILYKYTDIRGWILNLK
jgi:hypothetical protein